MEMNILLGYIGIALVAGGSFLASALALPICGQAAIGAMKKRPEAFGTYLIFSALPATQGIYGLVAFFMLRDFLVAGITIVQASAIFGVGLLMAAAGIYASLAQAKVCANGIEATASGHNVFAPTLILAVFPELYGIFALLVGILVSQVI
jgi:V/A-type H+-transporting ATPase subunit K